MKLADLRRLSIREQLRIHFRLRNGMECVVTEQGIAQVPGIKGVPAFNLEEELASAGGFLLEPVAVKPVQPKPPVQRSREELAAMLPRAATAAASEHEEE